MINVDEKPNILSCVKKKVSRIWVYLFLWMVNGGMLMSQVQIREPMVAGMFYPSDLQELDDMITTYLNESRKKVEDEIVRGIVAPHAGYVFSGPVAGWAYKQVEGKQYDIVVIISPSHYEAFYGCSIFPGDYYKTPLGMVAIDKSFAKKIIDAGSYIDFDERGHHPVNFGTGEHALEVQLPFLQKVLRDTFQIVPIVMGAQKKEIINDLAESLSEVLKGSNYLIVASSDLSHYHSYSEAQRLDRKIVDLFNAYKVDDLEAGIINNHLEACGGGPIVTMMKAIQKLENNQQKGQIVSYATSGDVPLGEKDRVVGYMAGIITVKNLKNRRDPVMKEEWNLSPDEKKLLFKIARESIWAELEGVSYHYPEEIPAKLKRISGAFVTLTIDGHLRGCIGYVEGVKPLYEAIHDMAIAAAFQDPRFSPLSREEFDKIDIEISILSPLKKIQSLDEVEVGRHGILIRKDFYSGLLLPQVAVEHHWDRKTFLEQTCWKAGLDKNCYKDPTAEIYIFSAEILHENEVLPKSE
jgi:hypothetical protein